MTRIPAAVCLILLVCALRTAAVEPTLLDDQFELPPGFHIYRAAQPQFSMLLTRLIFLSFLLYV